MSVGQGQGVKYSNVKVSRSNVPPPKPLAAMSSRAPSWRLAEAPLRASCETGCNSGSVQTLLHTSVRRVAQC